MKQILFILAIVLLGCQTKDKPNSVDFKALVYDLNNPKDSIEFGQWKQTYLDKESQINKDTLFSQDSIPIGVLYYSDEQFLVYGSCMGEFGGDLMFQDRETKDSIYYLRSTCAVMIDKRQDGYYITETLAHGNGSGRVIFLKSPKNLINKLLDSIYPNWINETINRIVSKTDRDFQNVEWDLKSKLREQGEILIDTHGITINLFFPFNNQDYLIYSDWKNTYVGLKTQDSIVKIDTLLNIPTWRYTGQLNSINNGYYHYNFKRKNGYSDDKIIRKTTSSGDIYAKSDSIVIAFKHKEKIKTK